MLVDWLALNSGTTKSLAYRAHRIQGSWLGLWLSELGAKVSGIGLKPITEPNLLLARTRRKNIGASHRRHS